MNPLDKDHHSSVVEILAPPPVHGIYGNSKGNDKGKQAWEAEFTPILDPRYKNEKSNFELSSKKDFMSEVENLKGSYRQEEEYQTLSKHQNSEDNYRGNNYERIDDLPEFRNCYIDLFTMVYF